MGLSTNVDSDQVETGSLLVHRNDSQLSAKFASLLPSPSGPSGSKRNRRMRSISEGTSNMNAGKKGAANSLDERKDSPHRKSSPDSHYDSSAIANNNSIPIFLKKTYKMIDTCDPDIACWNESGDMFVVKDPDRFSKEIIPQYFDHNKFASFARQLNFYGFRKMQVKPIRNADFDQDSAKHVTFFNEKFKRGRCDLLKDIQRSTRGGAHASNFQDQQREIESLQKKVDSLEQQLSDLSFRFEERIQGLEFSLMRHTEEAILAMQKQMHMQSTQGNLNQPSTQGQPQQQNFRQESMNSQNSQMDPAIMNAIRSMSVGSQNGTSDMQQWQNQQQQVNAMNMNLSQQAAMMGMNSKSTLQQNNPTLPPHPKQKQLNVTSNELPVSMRQPPLHTDQLRGISQMRNGTNSSNGSGVVMRNSWEDKFFSMLMLGENDPKQATANVERFLRQASQGSQQGLNSTNLAQLQGQLLQQQQGQSIIKREETSQLLNNTQMFNQNGTDISHLNKLGTNQMQPPMNKKIPGPMSGRKESRNNTFTEQLSSGEVSPSGSNLSLSDV